jgi:hypothetical protein
MVFEFSVNVSRRALFPVEAKNEEGAESAAARYLLSMPSGEPGVGSLDVSGAGRLARIEAESQGFS